MKAAVRPDPLPRSPHVMNMRWSQLLFAHWPVDLERMASVVPPALEVEAYEGSAWVGVVPFLMSHVRGAGLPRIPGTHRFPELNVRTYVRPRGTSGDDARSGVYFFSLDASNRLAVEGARRLFHLGYVHARMSIEGDDTRRRFASTRVDRRWPAADFRAEWSVRGPAREVKSGDGFDDWATSRWRLFSVDRRGRAYRGEIDHPAWRLAPADADLDPDPLLKAAGLGPAHGPPRLAAAEPVDVRAWLIRRVRRDRAGITASTPANAEIMA